MLNFWLGGVPKRIMINCSFGGARKMRSDNNTSINSNTSSSGSSSIDIRRSSAQRPDSSR